MLKKGHIRMLGGVYAFAAVVFCLYGGALFLCPSMVGVSDKGTPVILGGVLVLCAAAACSAMAKKLLSSHEGNASPGSEKSARAVRQEPAKRREQQASDKHNAWRYELAVLGIGAVGTTIGALLWQLATTTTI